MEVAIPLLLLLKALSFGTWKLMKLLNQQIQNICLQIQIQVLYNAHQFYYHFLIENVILGANLLKINDYTALLVGGTGTDMALSTEAQSFTIENGFKVEYQYSSLSAPEHFGSVAFLTEKRFFKCDYEIKREPENLIFAEDMGLIIDQ